MNTFSFAFILFSLASCSGKDPAPRVTTTHGCLVSTHSRTRSGRKVSGFLGIPYAKPPVGKLRFEPPEPPEPWSGVRPAVKQPPRCYQLIKINSYEDCLYLNVYTRNIFSRPLLPVLMYIFGGVFEIGGAADNTPEFLLDEDLVFVSINYRLGLFGFLTTGDQVVPGNMGVKDVILGLKWVRDNIRHFGGDPDKVTIYGQSSGAEIVHLLMIFVEDQGLFRAGISGSGSALNPWSIRPPEEIPKMVAKLASLSRCPSDSKGFVKCLKSKTAFGIFALYMKYKNTMYKPLNLVFTLMVPMIGPVLEADCVKDRIITANPWRRNTNIPWMVGVVSKESLFHLIAEVNDRTGLAFSALNKVFDKVFPLLMNYQNSDAHGSQVPSAMRSFYLNKKPIRRATQSQLVDAISDGYFIYGIYESLLRAKTTSLYLYYFDYVGANRFFPIPIHRSTGACHTDELYLIYPHPELPFQNRITTRKKDVRLSKTIIKFIYNFITFLNPTPGSDLKIEWRPFYQNESYLHIKQDELVMDNGFLPDRMEFWKTQPFPLRDDDFNAPSCSGITTDPRF